MFSAAIKKMHFSQAMQITRPDQIFLVRGKDTHGRTAWYYVLVDRVKRDSFKGKAGVPFLRLTDYGQILHSGFGANPPESIIQLMEEEYGFRE
jgi:hypothetical protein